MAKGIPYGISDFSRLIDQNYYYALIPQHYYKIFFLST